MRTGMLTFNVVVAFRRGVNTRDCRRPVQQADSPLFCFRSASATVTRMGPVCAPTLIRTRSMWPLPGTTIDSLGLLIAPLVVQLHDGTCWKKMKLWHVAVESAGRRRFAPN